jgi:hypothetical protein
MPDALTRRRMLRLLGGLSLAPFATLLGPAHGIAETRRAAYVVDVSLLWESIGLNVSGALEETVDRAAGRYEIMAKGAGSRITHHIESRGVLRAGRWAPAHTLGRFDVMGRQSLAEVRYDYDRGLIDYRARGETFFLRRVRVSEDVVPLPPGGLVDDAFSAVLNYADGRWTPGPDGQLRTHVVRRQRPEKEGADDVLPFYRAEVVPLAFAVAPDRETGRPSATIDLTRFSSWARDGGKSGRIVFGTDRRPESVTASLILGTTLTVRLASPG